MSFKIKSKNILSIFLVIIFAFGILTTSVLRASAQTSSENYQIDSLTKEEATEEGELTEEQEKVDYFLVYPGVLPDHFLYPIKMVRDRIWLWLTMDPLKKAELLLLFADKRLGAGKVLIEGNKVDLGVTTFSKAEKYLQRAANQERVAAQKDKDTMDFVKKLYNASLKHEEVLMDYQEKCINENSEARDDILEVNQQVQDKAEPLLE